MPVILMFDDNHGYQPNDKYHRQNFRTNYNTQSYQQELDNEHGVGRDQTHKTP